MTWDEWIEETRTYFSDYYISKRDILILLTYVTKSTYSDIIINGGNILTLNQYLILNNLIERLKKGEPVSYLIQECEFWSLKLKVAHGTFIPRIDTECLVDFVLKLQIKNKIDVLDLGTGNGAISLALAYEKPQWNITGIDCLLNSVLIAKKNAQALNLYNVKFYFSDWFKNLKNDIKYDLIISNPPYISYNDVHLLDKNIFFEPKTALISKNDGLKDIIHICKYSRFFLKRYGWLILEHGWNQKNSVNEILKSFRFVNIINILDTNYKYRVVAGQFLNF